MLRAIILRLLATLPVLVGVSLVVFFTLHLVPGDPVLTFYGMDLANVDNLEAMRQSLGLDDPLGVQFLRFLSNATRGDLGYSIKTRQPVTSELARYIANTAQLASVGIVIAVGVGLMLGVLAGWRPYSIWDNISLGVSLVGISLPIFWVGLLLIWLFAVKLSLLPSGGKGGLKHLILPALTMSGPSIAAIARVTRASMLEVLDQDYVRTARSKGLLERVVLLRHVVPNGLIPVITVVGLQFGYLLSGTVLTETVFAWPGLGRYVVDAIKFRDYPVVQGGVLVIAVMFVLVNLLVDILYHVVDPRLRTEGQL